MKVRSVDFNVRLGSVDVNDVRSGMRFCLFFIVWFVVLLMLRLVNNWMMGVGKSHVH